MSRKTVRDAVVSFFEPPVVDGLNKVYSTFPKRIPGTDYRVGKPSGSKSGAVGVVNILSEREHRISFGGEHAGEKMVHYRVELQIYCHSVETHTEDAMIFFDSVIDGVKDRLRSERRLLAWPVIFEAGEEELIGFYGEPRVMNDGASQIWGGIRFDVSEVVRV